ncbi:MAG TPA: DUF3685 domain-containing protein [Nostocaceae cyanobacterium]|nr:DUF3685 domain-containing protein [Nostocaceae cyanobacterium]
MGDRTSSTINLLLIDSDPIFRLGLRVALETNSDLKIIADVATDTAALQILVESASSKLEPVHLIILELGAHSQQLSLSFCQQLKSLYPQIPILLLTFVNQPELILAARAIGVNGYCPKGTPIAELINAIQIIAVGGYHWLTKDLANLSISAEEKSQPYIQQPAIVRLINNARLSGMSQIDITLNAVTAQLQIPDLTILEKAFLAGQRRELLAARWLVNHLLVTPQTKPQITPSQQINQSIPELNRNINKSEITLTETIPPLPSPRSLQSTLFTACINKLQFSLENITNEPLEIDILREDKKRELLYNILQKVTQQLDDLRATQIESQEITNLKDKLVIDLWQMGVRDFFGKFSRLRIGNNDIEISNFLLNHAVGVETEILQKIPLIAELFDYLLFQTDLYVDNTIYPVDSEQANSQAAMILENLLIQVANGVIQPLLNNFADVEIIKQSFYDRRLISTREIERFRNNLSWKYRLNKYVKEATAIFESRYELFVFAPRGIAKISIYAPRNAELSQLTGVPLVVTLMLEFRDAIAPRLKSLLSLFGNSLVFVLTQVVGRGLGLVGRGILQGIGSVSLTDKKLPRHSEKSK